MIAAPLHYVDLKLTTVTPIAAARALAILHGVFAHQPGRYALALPDYPRNFPRLRVFAPEGTDLDQLVAATEQHPLFKDLAHYTYPHTIGPDFKGPWISYRRYRIPSRKAERKPEANLRLRRIQEADAASLPYFALHSASNGNTWRLYLQAKTVSEPGHFAPDGYGLASVHRPFGLPFPP